MPHDCICCIPTLRGEAIVNFISCWLYSMSFPTALPSTQPLRRDLRYWRGGQALWLRAQRGLESRRMCLGDSGDAAFLAWATSGAASGASTVVTMPRLVLGSPSWSAR